MTKNENAILGLAAMIVGTVLAIMHWGLTGGLALFLLSQSSSLLANE